MIGYWLILFILSLIFTDVRNLASIFGYPNRSTFATKLRKRISEAPMICLCLLLIDFAEIWYSTLMHYRSGLVTEADDD